MDGICQWAGSRNIDYNFWQRGPWSSVRILGCALVSHNPYNVQNENIRFLECNYSTQSYKTNMMLKHFKSTSIFHIHTQRSGPIKWWVLKYIHCSLNVFQQNLAQALKLEFCTYLLQSIIHRTEVNFPKRNVEFILVISIQCPLIGSLCGSSSFQSSSYIWAVQGHGPQNETPCCVIYGYCISCMEEDEIDEFYFGNFVKLQLFYYYLVYFPNAGEF